MKIFDLFKKNETPVVTNSQNQSVASNVAENKIQDSTENESCMKEPVSSDPAEGSIAASDKTKRVHNLIILDESGSMQSIYRPALSGVNETLQTILQAQNEHPDQEHFVSLIAFDSGHYNQIYFNTPAEKAVDITEEQYRPGGCTPLYDAMGRSITELRRHVAKNDVVLVTVITDGYENASREYNGRAIKSLVEEMKKENWVFTYIGANQDVDAVASSMSIDNRLSFEANEASTDAMFARESRSRSLFFSRLSSNMNAGDLQEGYFDE